MEFLKQIIKTSPNSHLQNTWKISKPRPQRLSKVDVRNCFDYHLESSNWPNWCSRPDLPICIRPSAPLSKQAKQVKQASTAEKSFFCEKYSPAGQHSPGRPSRKNVIFLNEKNVPARWRGAPDGLFLSGLDRYLVDCTLCKFIYTHFEHFVKKCRKLLKYEFPDVCIVISSNS